MKFLSQVSLEQIPTFLPQDLIPTQPRYFVWFTGTLGQAEWLISHSKHLRGRALPLSCPKSPSDNDAIVPWRLLPPKLKPLMSLEQPDLIVTDAEGFPLISIEITEQQPVGLNAQQRMARFWSAVANRIPSHLDWEAAFQLGVLEVSRRLRNAEANQERAMPSHLSDSYSWLSRALIGKAEIDVQDFESFFVLNDDQKAIFDSLGGELNTRQFEDSFALIVDGKVQAILLPRKGIVIKADGEKLEIKSDCYMPVEQYYGDE